MKSEAFQKHGCLISGLIPTVGQKFPISFNGSVGRPGGAFVYDVAEVVEDVDTAPVAGDCQGVIEKAAFATVWEPIVSLFACKGIF